MAFNNNFSDDIVFTSFFSKPEPKDFDPETEAIIMCDLN